MSASSFSDAIKAAASVNINKFMAELDAMNLTALRDSLEDKA